ncbi:MAG: PAS domain S-box protein [Candidatus Gracilibacteria bacterium]|nr:PAS domain S-box protein [Candidatus Gracilibacteria bacterium]
MMKKDNQKHGHLNDFYYCSMDSEPRDFSNLPYLLNEKEKYFEQNEIVIEDMEYCLSDEERINLLELAVKGKQSILDIWIYSKEIKKFCSNYNISKDDKHYYFEFFGQKIYDYFIKNIESKTKLDNYFFTTKFFSYVKTKNIEIEELLKIVIYLKNVTLNNQKESFGKHVFIINNIFDEILTQLSKNYNDIIVKLLNEHKNAIDTSNIISKTNIQGLITYANDEFCRLSGYTLDELIGKPHNMVRHPDMPSEIFKDLWDTIQNKKVWKGIIKNKKKDGQAYWVKSAIVPILDENDNILEYISIRTDITEHIEANKNIQEYNDALNESNLVLKLDKNGIIIDANILFCKTFGYLKEELLGKVYIDSIGLAVDSSLDKLYQDIVGIAIVNKDTLYSLLEVLTWKNTWKGIIKNKSKQGLIIWCSTTIIPILDINNELKEYIVIKADITDIEIAKQHLKKSFHKLKELDKKKDEFLNIASHELRTPMTSIKGYISMILDGDAGEINEEVRQYLEQVYMSSGRLLSLINDMLDISKIEGGKQEFQYEKSEIRKLLNEVCFELNQLFINKKQELKLNIDFSDFYYNTDINKFKQVIVNILGNANKFTPEGGTVTIGSSVSENELIITISDNGIGIDKEHLESIFEKFGQVKNSLTRDITGTGLGLPIAKAIIEKMGGNISIRSEVGVGSDFTVRLPLKNQ